VGIDLAKNVFSLHGVDAAGKTVLRRTVRRDRLVETVASLSPCLIGMEACSGAHEWGRRFEQHGHTVKLMAPKFVAPYRKSDKNDGNDAEAVCEAVTRPNMRFVPVKSTEQQGLLALHRVRQGFVVERTAIINRLRGLLTEFGVVLPLRSVTVRRQAAQAAEGGCPSSRAGRSVIYSSSCACSMSASAPTTRKSKRKLGSQSRRGA
jgi:transposase